MGRDGVLIEAHGDEEALSLDSVSSLCLPVVDLCSPDRLDHLPLRRRSAGCLPISVLSSASVDAVSSLSASPKSPSHFSVRRAPSSLLICALPSVSIIFLRRRSAGCLPISVLSSTSVDAVSSLSASPKSPSHFQLGMRPPHCRFALSRLSRSSSSVDAARATSRFRSSASSRSLHTSTSPSLSLSHFRSPFFVPFSVPLHASASCQSLHSSTAPRFNLSISASRSSHF